MANAPAGKATGIDISYAQGTWPGNASDKFVIIRVSSADGGLHKDTRVAQHYAEAKKAGKSIAFYHFVQNSVSGVEQARLAVATMQELGAWGHKLFIDFEGTADFDIAHDCIKEAKRLLRPKLWRYRLRKRVGIYSGNTIKEHGGGTMDAQFGWLADYDAFNRPSGWSVSFTKLWQYTSTSNRGNLDLDAFMGDPKNLTRFFQPIDRDGRLV